MDFFTTETNMYENRANKLYKNWYPLEDVKIYKKNNFCIKLRKQFEEATNAYACAVGNYFYRFYIDFLALTNDKKIVINLHRCFFPPFFSSVY